MTKNAGDYGERAEPSRAKAEPSRAVSMDDGGDAAAVRGSKKRQQKRLDWSGGLDGWPWGRR